MSTGCHCGNIHVEMTLSRAPESYNPRACDCDFCSQHGAAYLSDSLGTLAIRARSERDVSRYRQGNNLADFLICRTCGVLIGVLYRSNDQLYGAINVRMLTDTAPFGPPRAVSPKNLTADNKMSRWIEIWFKDVRLTYDGP